MTEEYPVVSNAHMKHEIIKMMNGVLSYSDVLHDCMRQIHVTVDRTEQLEDMDRGMYRYMEHLVNLARCYDLDREIERLLTGTCFEQCLRCN